MLNEVKWCLLVSVLGWKIHMVHTQVTSSGLSCAENCFIGWLKLEIVNMWSLWWIASSCLGWDGPVDLSRAADPERASWRGLGFWSQFLLDVSLWRFSWHSQPMGKRTFGTPRACWINYTCLLVLGYLEIPRRGWGGACLEFPACPAVNLTWFHRR